MCISKVYKSIIEYSALVSILIFLPYGFVQVT